jgi:hypothetical protein
LPRNELRVTGMVQAVAIASGLALYLRGEPPGAPTSTWPYVLAIYGALAATAPWLAGGVGRWEFDLRYSALLGLFFGLPMAAVGTWLVPSAYRAIGIGGWALFALWVVHAGVAIVLAIARRERPPA